MQDEPSAGMASGSASFCDPEAEQGFSELDIESAVVAHYATDLDMSYEDIERMTGLSRATVARRLQHAKSRGWMLPPKLVAPEGLEREYRQRVQCVNLQDQLEKLLGGYGLRKATVVLDRQVRDDEAHAMDMTARIGQVAAARLLEALGKRRRTAQRDRIVIGINWGYSTRRTIECLPEQASANPDLAFVPLIGNLSVEETQVKEYEEAWLCSANRLARVASEKFNSGDPRRLATPAIIPKKFSSEKKTLDAIWEFIEEDASYRRVFGQGYHRADVQHQDTLISRMDTVVTGMSALEPTSSLVKMAHLVDHDQLSALGDAGYVGDLGGHLIDDPEHRVSDQKALDLAELLGDLVVSARPEDFIAVAERAARSRRDQWRGVFLIGRRPRKAPALVAACRMRAVTELFTDQSTAERMVELLGGEVGEP